MKISVIMPVYNGEKEITTCLDSIYKTKYKDFEVIVVDDCSTDKTPELLKELQKKYPFKVIKLKKNSGVSIARNKGAKNAKGELLYFVDDDTVQKTDNLFKIHKILKKDKDVDVINVTHHWKSLNKGFGPEFIGLKYYYDYDVAKRKNIKRLHGSFFQALGGFIPKNIFDELNGFNENIHLPGGEEFEFGHKLKDHNYKVFTYPELEVYHYWWTLPKRIKLNYQRAKVWSNLLIKQKSFESKGGIATKKNAINSLLITSTLILSLISIPLNTHNIPLILSITYLIYNFDFYKYIFKKTKSLNFIILSIIAEILLNLAASLGIGIGLIIKIIK